jgi:hypothetical protein
MRPWRLTWRWSIRIFFFGIAVICVAAWVGSHFRHVVARYGHGGIAERLDIDSGLIRISRPATDGKGLEWGAGPPGVQLEILYKYSDYHFLGFAVDSPRDHKWDAMVPCWFVTGVSAAALVLVWWYTRRKRLGASFPIEPKQKGTSFSQ